MSYYTGPIEVGMKFNTHGCYDDIGTECVEILGYESGCYTYGACGETATIWASTLRMYWTPVEQACLDRATAKPAPVMWRAGMWATATEKRLGEPDFQINETHAKLWNKIPPMMWKPRDEKPATLDHSVKECGKDIGGVSAGVACNKAEGHYGSCHWYVDRGPRRMIAKTAPERKLAGRWMRITSEHRRGRIIECDRCGGIAVYGEVSVPSDPDTFVGRMACEAHAAEMGVFELVQEIAAPPPCPSPAKCLLCGQIACSCVGTGAPTRPTKPSCPRCTHRHVGPCNGTSPNGEFSCPCGHERVEANREVKVHPGYAHKRTPHWNFVDSDGDARQSMDWIDRNVV